MRDLLLCILAASLVCPAAQAASAELKVQLGHSGDISSVAFSPDGRFALTGSWDHTARLWDLSSGREIRRFEDTGWVLAVAFSPDGRSLLTGSADNAARLWDLSSGREIRRFEGDLSLVFSVAFSPDGRSVLTGSNHAARLWDANTGREIRRFEGHSDDVKSVAFSPDGRSVLTGSADKTARLWDASSGREIHRFEGHSDSVISVAFSPDGRSALTGGDKTARLWDITSGHEIARFEGHSGDVESVVFSPDGRSVLTGSVDNTARLWDVRSAREIHRFEGHAGYLEYVAFSPDGLSILTAGDKTAALWDVASGREIRRLEGHSDSVSSVAISPDGRSVLTGSPDHIARLWDVTGGSEIRRFEGDSGYVTCVAFSPDGHSVLTGSVDKTPRLWDVSDGREIRRFEGHSDSVVSVAFSPDGRSILTGSWDKTARLWDLSTGREIRRFEGHSEYVTSVAFSPDGRSVLTGSDDRTARLWDLSTGQEIRRFEEDSDKVSSVAFSPDGQMVLTGNDDNLARLWDVRSGREIRRFKGHESGIMTVAFSPDGRSVLTGSLDKTARLWDVSSGREIHRFEGHSDWVGSVAFFPDGRTVLTGSFDGTSKIWDSNAGLLLATMASFRDGGWAVVDSAGRFDTNELDGGSALYWIVDDHPDQPLPLEIFMRQYFTPRLLPRLLAGEKLPAVPNIAAINRAQPEVSIAKLEPDPNNADALRVTVNVKSQSSGAKDLRLFRDGQMVAFRAGDVKDGEYTFAAIRLPHRGPKQPVVLTAYAFNNDLVKSATATKEYSLPDTWPVRKGRAFLVDIGINRMAARGCNLQYAVSDAVAMQGAVRQRLEAAGFAVEAYLLTADDSQPNGSSKDRWRSVLAEIAAKATPDDTFILTYSGHGYSDPQGMFYLFPSDLQGDCGQVDSVLKQSATSDDDLTNWIRPIDAGEMVMILDACYSAASIENNDFKPGPMGNRGLGQLAYDKRIRVLAASQATQPAGEAGALGMGYLSYALVKNGLTAGQADWQPKDGSIWLREWLAYGVEQTPKLYGDVQAGDQKNRGVIAASHGKNTVSLQTPALFDFRAQQDAGLRLN